MKSDQMVGREIALYANRKTKNEYFRALADLQQLRVEVQHLKNQLARYEAVSDKEKKFAWLFDDLRHELNKTSFVLSNRGLIGRLLNVIAQLALLDGDDGEE